MADLVWYYARGDVERGPFTSLQIRALVNASKVRPDDLVWKEGMENWTVAREVAELFPAAGLVGEGEPVNGAETATSAPRPAESTAAAPAPLPDDVRMALHRVARTFTLLGVVLVLATSGCESLGERRVARLNAVAELSGLESTADSEELRRSAAHATLQHQASAFTRGIVLYMSLAVLLVGSIGLLILAEDYERWFGMGVVLVVICAALGGLR